MLLTLTRHPETPCEAVTRIDVEVTRERAICLALRYVVTGDIVRVSLPEPIDLDPVDSGRADDLWRTTCLEAFVSAGAGDAYLELNLSPSLQWAAYGFDGYRSGMTALDGVTLWEMESFRLADGHEVRAVLELDWPAGLPFDAPWRLGLSAVIEETDGRKSYWALAHPSGRPDFHHSDGFAAFLPPVIRS